MQGSVRTHLAALVALVVLAPGAGAQAVERIDAARPEPMAATPAIPSREAASVAVRAPAARRDVANDVEPAAAAAFGRGETLMIVGGAALLAGLIIGDDAGTVIAVGGAIVGLYGLYLYLGTQ
jgi:hypothetical protein